jgi:hypothetical protein
MNPAMKCRMQTARQEGGPAPAVAAGADRSNSGSRPLFVLLSLLHRDSIEKEDPMKQRFLLSLCLLVLATASLWSQPTMRTPAERASQLKERLSLTEEQTIAVEIIFEERQKEVAAKMDSLRGDREAMRAFMMGEIVKTDKEIEALLSDEQKTKYEALKKERRERRGGTRR